jgi:tetratricopeptide (TPR) repeat protein
MTTNRRTILIGRPRPIAILAAALMLASATWVGQWISRSDSSPIGAARPAQDAPAVNAPFTAGPADADGLPALDLTALDDQIELWSRKAAANDNDYISATNLGVLYLGRARLTGDLADYDRASQAVARALAADPAFTAARALDGVVRYATHDFTGALAAAEALLTDEPGQVDALTVVADANLELGRIDTARTAYDELRRLAPGPSLDARLARLSYLTGDPAGALELAQGARATALAQDVADSAFFDYQLGEMARLVGDAETARTAFEAALTARPSDRAALLGLARLDAVSGRTDQAIEWLRAAATMAPEPTTLALLGDLLMLTGDAAAAEDQFKTVRFTAQLGTLAGTVYDRQLLLFELDHGGASAEFVARAREALGTRADAAGHDLLAWALYRTGDVDGAWAEIDAARSSGIVDARILYHAGAIAIARDDAEAGRPLLEQALALGPALDPIEREEAERLLGR